MSLKLLMVVERDFSINEIREAVAEGRIVEAFFLGIAVSICVSVAIKKVPNTVASILSP